MITKGTIVVRTQKTMTINKDYNTLGYIFSVVKDNKSHAYYRDGASISPGNFRLATPDETAYFMFNNITNIDQIPKEKPSYLSLTDFGTFSVKTENRTDFAVLESILKIHFNKKFPSNFDGLSNYYGIPSWSLELTATSRPFGKSQFNNVIEFKNHVFKSYYKKKQISNNELVEKYIIGPFNNKIDWDNIQDTLFGMGYKWQASGKHLITFDFHQYAHICVNINNNNKLFTTNNLDTYPNITSITVDKFINLTNNTKNKQNEQNVQRVNLNGERRKIVGRARMANSGQQGAVGSRPKGNKQSYLIEEARVAKSKIKRNSGFSTTDPMQNRHCGSY